MRTFSMNIPHHSSMPIDRPEIVWISSRLLPPAKIFYLLIIFFDKSSSVMNIDEPQVPWHAPGFGLSGVGSLSSSVVSCWEVICHHFEKALPQRLQSPNASLSSQRSFRKGDSSDSDFTFCFSTLYICVSDSTAPLFLFCLFFVSKTYVDLDTQS
ncbi:hypothetical protein CEXT_321 [Caerostris extrusa]|uniref:Uncharacterized protein n=1 Tax=Caerostris extrusa TaxID=172846 RepID=A0AAV4X381_CAEEX|nr:hypothetical protein CEXT_321 [Caerostris extrusa]